MRRGASSSEKRGSEGQWATAAGTLLAAAFPPPPGAATGDASGEQRRAAETRSLRTEEEEEDPPRAPSVAPLCSRALPQLQSPRPHHVAARGGAAPPLARGAGMLRSRVMPDLRRRAKASPRPPPGPQERLRGTPRTQSSSTALLPTVTSAPPDAKRETGWKKWEFVGKDEVGEVFLVLACYSPSSLVLLLSSPLARACHPDKEMQVVSL